MIPTGTKVAVVAPCGAYDPHRLEQGLAIARALGHDLRLLPGTLQPHRYLAAPDEVRFDHLLEALTSPEYGAVWLARGGFGLTRLLPRIPFDELPSRPVIGFSDATALFTAMRGRGGPAIHGPVVHSLPNTDEPSRRHLFDLLGGRPVAPLVGETWIPGRADGRLVGGNLTLLASLCGTPWSLDARGAIVVLEDVTEAPFRIDRCLQQLSSSGAFDGAVGFAVGEFDKCDPPAGSTWTLKDVLLDHLGRMGVPVVGGLPIGHGARNHAFPVGAPATLVDGTVSWRPANRIG